MTPELLQALARLRERRIDAVLCTRLCDGVQILLRDLDGRLRPDPSLPEQPALPLAVLEAATQAWQAEQGLTLPVEEEEWFLDVQAPTVRLVIVGAVQTAEILCAMAVPLGLAVVVVDPREALVAGRHFRAATTSTAWPDEAMAALPLDRRSAVVTLTHDAKLDDPALVAALPGPAFYVGALGSRRTHAARRERLAEAGVPAAALARLRAPVGLRIGAVGPAEIAVSILAEIIAMRRGALDDVPM